MTSRPDIEAMWALLVDRAHPERLRLDLAGPPRATLRCPRKRHAVAYTFVTDHGVLIAWVVRSPISADAVYRGAVELGPEGVFGEYRGGSLRQWVRGQRPGGWFLAWADELVAEDVADGPMRIADCGCGTWTINPAWLVRARGNLLSSDMPDPMAQHLSDERARDRRDEHTA